MPIQIKRNGGEPKGKAQPIWAWPHKFMSLHLDPENKEQF